MADISKINLSGVEYDVKDAVARASQTALESELSSKLSIYISDDEPAELNVGDLWYDGDPADTLNPLLNAKVDKDQGVASAGKILGINDSGIVEAIDKPTSGVWGQITGTLANQTDLNNALNAKIPTSQKGANGGVAELDNSGKVPSSQLPDGIGNLFIAVEDVTTYDEIVAAVAAGKNVVLRRQRESSDKFWQLSEIYHYSAQEVEDGAENRIVFMRTDSSLIEEGADLEDLCVRKTKVYKDDSGNTIYSTDTGIFTPTVYDMEQKQDVISDLETIRSGAALGATSIQSSAKGANSGIAELDENGKVPSAQLPSYVDDVLEYAALSDFPATGESGKIYIAIDTNITYRWSGTTYVAIGSDLALGETSSTAYRGDRGAIAYTHSQSAHAPVDAQKNVQSDWNATSGDALILNKPSIPDMSTKQDKNITLINTTVSSFTEQTGDNIEYESFPFVADISISGVTANDFAEVVLSVEDSMSGEYAPVVQTYAGGVYLYKASALDDGETLTIPTILIIKG